MSDSGSLSTPPSNLEVLQKYWDATTTGDIEALRTLIADDAVFHYPGQHYISGDYRGPDEVANLYKTVTGLGKGMFEGRLHDVAVSQQSIYTLPILSYRLKIFAGRTLPGRACGLLRISNGKIREYWLFEWDQAMINDVWWSSAPRVFLKQKDYVRLLLSLPRIVLGLARTLSRVFGGYRAPTEPF